MVRKPRWGNERAVKISETYPPNYEEICSVIPAVRHQKGIVFTYGDTIYNPDKQMIEDHLECHEETHEKQQAKIGIDEWWKKYLEDPKFRLEQEVEAYRAQYKMVSKVYGRASATELVKSIAKDLSGAMYGNILKYKEARKAIIK